ncbi:MAG TPA: CARDB domain-containing protein [Anaerolineae bacterium]|nr:CARDB domain-containing protein [Anaerolineae bacterium]
MKTKKFSVFGAFAVIAVILLLATASAAASVLVADSDAEYLVCGRVFPDPHAYWPSPAQAPSRSPFAKGNAPCAATDFISYSDMVNGMTYLETLFPQFIEFYNLEQDFGDGSDCVTSTSSEDLCSAGLPRQGAPPTRIKSDLYMIRVTDERVPDTDKRLFVFPLSIHGIERAGAEAGVRAAEDLATWAYCEALAEGTLLPNALTNCGQEGAIPHPLLETQPETSLKAGEALERSAVYFVFANPDGWKRGDLDNLVRFYQRYNGNGVDLNRDWPTIGFTFRPYTPWSEPESRAFGQVLKDIRERWDGGIDLHGQLVDRAFSFTLLGASERDFAKNERILQTVKGAWEDAEARLAWSPLIKPNDAPPQCTEVDPGEPCDNRVYGVQWGTVWDTIDYTTSGSLGDWIDSPLGLGADGIDNEMSLSHLSNCGLGSCYLPDAEQLHVDGNKSLVYAMVNFTLLPEDQTFRAPGKVGYVFDPTRISHPGSPVTAPPCGGLPQQAPILNQVLSPANNFTFEFVIQGAGDGVCNGGVESMATPENVGGIGPGSLTSLVIEQYQPAEPPAQSDNTRCATAQDNWEEVNRYYNQASTYLQSGQAVHANEPTPGRWRICLTGGLADQIASTGGTVDLDISFSGEQAWADPGQLPYDVSNMKFFEDLAPHMASGQLVSLNVDDILSGAVNLDQFTSIVVADDAFPGYTEGIATGPAQASIVHEPPAETAATVPCAFDGDLQPVLPPTCHADYEFDVDPAFNNQQLIVMLDSPDSVENDWDLHLQRQSRITGEWFTIGASTSSTGDERVTMLTPPVGRYRAQIVNWAGTVPPTRLEIAFSNVYAGPPIPPSTRTDAERDAWGLKLRSFVQNGGNLVLTDGAIKNLAYMGLIPRTVVNTFGVFAGFIGFTRDGTTSTYDDPLAFNVNQPGAAEGPQFRHQTYEPVPIGYDVADAPSTFPQTSPVWAIDQIEWERAGGRTAGITTPDQVTLGELQHGAGVVRVIGALLPMPTDRYYHPFGLANYALTYSGYQVFNNTLQWQRPLPDLTLLPGDISLSMTKVGGGDRVVIAATVRNAGAGAAVNVAVRFTDNGTPIGVDQVVASIPVGGSATASVVWDTKHLQGDRTITVAADPADAILELDEANNSASVVVTVRGNKVRNGSFESSSNGTSPDDWSSSGETTYAQDGSDGERSVTAGATGSWISDAIDVVAGRTYGVSVDVAGVGGSLVVEQYSATGALLSTVTRLLSVTNDGLFHEVATTVSIAADVTQVRLKLTGALIGSATLDNVRMWEE